MFLTAQERAQLVALMVGCVSTKDFIREIAEVLRGMHYLNRPSGPYTEQARCLEAAICLMPEDKIDNAEPDLERARRIVV